jgi:hypothetical protein
LVEVVPSQAGDFMPGSGLRHESPAIDIEGTCLSGGQLEAVPRIPFKRVSSVKGLDQVVFGAALSRIHRQ